MFPKCLRVPIVLARLGLVASKELSPLLTWGNPLRHHYSDMMHDSNCLVLWSLRRHAKHLKPFTMASQARTHTTHFTNLQSSAKVSQLVLLVKLEGARGGAKPRPLPSTKGGSVRCHYCH